MRNRQHRTRTMFRISGSWLPLLLLLLLKSVFLLCYASAAPAAPAPLDAPALPATPASPAAVSIYPPERSSFLLDAAASTATAAQQLEQTDGIAHEARVLPATAPTAASAVAPAVAPAVATAVTPAASPAVALDVAPAAAPAVAPAAAPAVAPAAASAAAPAAAPAASIPFTAEAAASAVLAAAAGPAASLPQNTAQQQQEATFNTAVATDTAGKAAAAAVAAAAAAGAISAELVREVAATANTAATDAETFEAEAEEEQEGETAENSENESSFFSIIFSPLRSLPAALAEKLKGAIRIAAVAAAVLMQLTPLPTIARVVSCRSTMGLESLPYFTLLFSASLWLLYGVLLVEPTILLPNTSGVIAGGWFVLTFWANTSREDKQRFLLALYLKVGAMIFAALLLICVCCPYEFAELVVGLAASIVNVVSYAAPLAALRVVLKERSTAMMPAEMSIGNFICSALWLAYGWIAEDIFIIVPNLLGFGVGAAQLLLLAFIPPPSRQGFSAVCSSSAWRRSACSKGVNGGPTALLRRAEDYTWEDHENYFADSTTATTPVLKTSVIANAPSLPTHDELLKKCGFPDDPELAYGFEDELD